MRLRTIWTMPAMTLRERFSRTSEWFWLNLSRHLPARLRYWTFITTGSDAMTTNEVIPDVKFMDLLDRMDNR